MHLVELLNRPDGKSVGLKRALSVPEGALRSIVAFANTAGGTLLAGVEDKSGHVRAGVEPLDPEDRGGERPRDGRCWPYGALPRDNTDFAQARIA